jgi:hypothetical protein
MKHVEGALQLEVGLSVRVASLARINKQTTLETSWVVHTSTTGRSLEHRHASFDDTPSFSFLLLHACQLHLSLDLADS